MERGSTTQRWFFLILVIILIVASGMALWIRNPQIEEKLNVAVVMWGHHDEGLWDPAAANAVLNLEEKYNLKITWAEGVVLTELEGLLENLAELNDVIYLTTDEFE